MATISSTTIMNGRSEITLGEFYSAVEKEGYDVPIYGLNKSQTDRLRLITFVVSLLGIAALVNTAMVAFVMGRTSPFSVMCGLAVAVGIPLLATHISWTHHLTSVRLNEGRVKHLLQKVKVSAEEDLVAFQRDQLYVNNKNHESILKQQAERIQPDA